VKLVSKIVQIANLLLVLVVLYVLHVGLDILMTQRQKLALDVSLDVKFVKLTKFFSVKAVEMDSKP
jgi:hypothetical protein